MKCKYFYNFSSVLGVRFLLSSSSMGVYMTSYAVMFPLVSAGSAQLSCVTVGLMTLKARRPGSPGTAEHLKGNVP